MKPTTTITLFLCFLLLGGCKAYDYLNTATGSFSGAGNFAQCRETNKKTGNLTTTATSEFYVLEVRNTGGCPVNVKIEFPAGTEIGTKQIPAGSHQVFAENVPAHNAGDKFAFTMNCPDADMGNCVFNYKAKLCDNINGKPTNPDYSVEPTGEKTIPADPAVINGCNNENTPLDLLTISNNTQKDHLAILKMKNTGRCAQLTIKPPGIVADQNIENSTGYIIKKNTPVTFKAYCKGNNIINPLCRGQILEMKMKPKK